MGSICKVIEKNASLLCPFVPYMATFEYSDSSVRCVRRTPTNRAGSSLRREKNHLNLWLCKVFMCAGAFFDG